MEETRQPIEAPVGHEQSDVSIRPLVMFGVGLFLSVGLALLAMHWLGGYFATHQPKPAVEPSPLADTRQIPPPPRLQVSPPQDLRTMRAAEDAVLNSYGWVDRDAGVVRIPIDRALELAVEHGFSLVQVEKGRAKK